MHSPTSMRNLKHIYLPIFVLLPALHFAQTGSTATSCPDWSKKKYNAGVNYLEYLRNNQGKKVNHNDPFLASAKTLDTTKEYIHPEQRVPAKNNFYTQKRYSLFPKKAEQTKSKSTEKPEPKAKGNTSANPLAVDKPVQQANAQPQVDEVKNNPGLVAAKPVDELLIVNPNETTTQTQGGDGSTKVESSKTHTSKLRKKLSHIFSKKTNKPAKPHYERCTTKF